MGKTVKDYFKIRKTKKLKGNHRVCKLPNSWYYERETAVEERHISDILEKRIGRAWADVKHEIVEQCGGQGRWWRQNLDTAIDRLIVSEYSPRLSDGSFYVDEEGVLCKYSRETRKIELRIYITRFYDVESAEFYLNENGWFRREIVQEMEWSAWEERSIKRHRAQVQSLSGRDIRALSKMSSFFADHKRVDRLREVTPELIQSLNYSKREYWAFYRQFKQEIERAIYPLTLGPHPTFYIEVN